MSSESGNHMPPIFLQKVQIVQPDEAYISLCLVKPDGRINETPTLVPSLPYKVQGRRPDGSLHDLGAFPSEILALAFASVLGLQWECVLEGISIDPDRLLSSLIDYNKRGVPN